jgi:hypothetical protein
MCEKCLEVDDHSIDFNDPSSYKELVNANGEFDRFVALCKCPCTDDMLELNDPPFHSQTYLGEPVEETSNVGCNKCEHNLADDRS